MLFRLLPVLLAAIALVGAATTQAHAYIDPGSGSALLSIIIGAFVAVGLAVKSFWYKITGFFGGNKGADQDDV